MLQSRDKALALCNESLCGVDGREASRGGPVREGVSEGLFPGCQVSKKLAAQLEVISVNLDVVWTPGAGQRRAPLCRHQLDPDSRCASLEQGLRLLHDLKFDRLRVLWVVFQQGREPDEDSQVPAVLDALVDRPQVARAIGRSGPSLHDVCCSLTSQQPVRGVCVWQVNAKLLKSRSKEIRRISDRIARLPSEHAECRTVQPANKGIGGHVWQVLGPHASDGQHPGGYF